MDFRKAGFHAYSNKANVSSTNDSCTHQQTIQTALVLRVPKAALVCCGLFLMLVRCLRVLRSSLNGSIFPGQAHSWL